MTDYLDQLRYDLLQWARRAAAQHWLEPATLASLEQQSLASPANLFTGAERPLVAGLFGGTGVGKSSLLNRLAHEPIAVASAERPTSRDITVYVHRSVTVSRLPDHFPMERMRTTLHQRDDYRHVMWIDMPDFDSVETSHRDQVDQWLPHLDVIVYVVSPERYRDDDGWRLLQANARGHAWLFVMNQWDRGDPLQLEDFRDLLQQAGFADPMLFATDCRTVAEQPVARDSTMQRTGEPVQVGDTGRDDFTELEQTITALADSQLITQLGELGVIARAHALREVADAARASMGEPECLQTLIGTWPAHWQRVSDGISQAAVWPIATLAGRLAQTRSRSPSGPVTGILASLKPAFLIREQPPAIQPETTSSERLDLLDVTLAERIDTGIDQFVQAAPEAGVPPHALAKLFSDGRATRLASASAQVEQTLARSMARPGTHWQRLLYRGAGLCVTFLPLLALCWIGIRIVGGYWRGGADTSAYLGSDFAIHSLLLLGVAWALPAFARYRLEPSREAAAVRGLRQGLDGALDELGEQIEARLNDALDARRQLDASYEAVWHESRADADPQLPEQARRLLFEPTD